MLKMLQKQNISGAEENSNFHFLSLNFVIIVEQFYCYIISVYLK